MSVTYALNRSSNELLPYSLPSTTGFLSITNNLQATVQNTDWEFSVNTVNIKAKKISSWKTTFNLTIPQEQDCGFSGN